MDVKQLLEQTKERLESKKDYITDISQFEYDSMPRELYIREKESIQIVESIMKYYQFESPENLLYFGSRGCGKTVLLKYLQNEFQKELSLPIIYANCRFYNSAFKLLQHILNMDLTGLALADAYLEFEKVFKKAILVLDEFDLLYKRNELLYFLSRSESARYMVIILTNDPGLYDKIDPSAKSTLQFHIEHFQDYNATEISNILLLRCKYGLKEINPDIEGIINKIGAYTSKQGFGDVRIALKTLKLYILSDETDRSEKIENFFHQSKRDLYQDIISSLSSKHKLILKSICLCNDKFTRNCFNTFRDICRTNNKKGINYNQFYNEINYLQSLGLIMLFQIRGGVGRARNMIKICFNSDLLDSSTQNLVSEYYD